MDSLIIFTAQYVYLAVVLIAVLYVLLQPKDKIKKIIIFAVILFPITYLAAKIAGHFYFDPRPFVVEHSIPLIPHAADNGFPSDHTLLCAAFASIIYFYNKKVSVVLWMLTLAVGLARVYAKIHHPADIAGSIVIAAAVAALLRWVIKKYFETTSAPL